jgi:hypothetical protein
MGSAGAQSIFTRGGPTIIDRLVGNGNYGGYGNYGAYPNYGGYGNYYANRWPGRCHRYNYGNYRNYGNMGYMGYMGHHHRHRRW